MFVNKDELHMEVTNLPEFDALVAKAKKEADQLNQTVDQLARFELVIRFSAERIKQGT